MFVVDERREGVEKKSRNIMVRGSGQLGCAGSLIPTAGRAALRHHITSRFLLFFLTAVIVIAKSAHLYFNTVGGTYEPEKRINTLELKSRRKKGVLS